MRHDRHARGDLRRRLHRGFHDQLGTDVGFLKSRAGAIRTHHDNETGCRGARIFRTFGDTRGERTTGTVLGAAAGALLGREVQRSGQRDRCYR